MAKEFGFGSDDRGRRRRRGQRPDRRPEVEAGLLEGDEGLLLQGRRKNTTGQRDFLHVFAHEFCLEGFNYRAGDAVNFVIGQGDTMVTPLQLARAYSALSNGGKLMAPRVAKAVVSPDGKLIKEIKPKVAAPDQVQEVRARVRRQRAQGHPQGGHPGVEVRRLPARQGAAARQDRLGRGLRQADDLVGRDVHQGLRRDHDDHPGRHRLRHLRPGGPQDLGAPLRHQGREGEPEEGRHPRHHAARAAADLRPRRVDPAAEHRDSRRETTDDRPADEAALDRPQPRRRTPPRLGALRRRRPDPRGRHAAGLVGHLEQRGADPRRLDGLPPQAPRQHHDRPRARRLGDGDRPPVGAHRHAAGLRRLGHRAGAGAGDGHDDQRVALVADARRALDPAGRVRQARRGHRHGDDHRRARRELPPASRSASSTSR